MPRLKQITRFGAYGIILKDSQILLTQKKSGPYRDQWGLPGGSIEYGETPEQAFTRELLEESALEAGEFEFISHFTHTGDYPDYGFHQVGIIYRVLDWKIREDLIPQEKNRWTPVDNVDRSELTPFAKQALLGRL